MAVAGVLATQLNPTTTHTRGLFIDNVDVIDQPTAANVVGYGVPLESVQVTEMGPGSVSSMEFVIDDPLMSLTVTPGQVISFWDFANDLPIFLGFVQAVDTVVAFGEQGRAFKITGVGVEAVLDWAVLTSDLVFAADAIFNNQTAALQQVVTTSTGLGPIRAFARPINNSIQAYPIGTVNLGTVNSNAITIPKGTTVREALRLVWTAVVPTAIQSVNVWAVTVDFYYGLRIAPIGLPGYLLTDDYGFLIVNNTTAVDFRSENLDYAQDNSSYVHTVLVVGTGVSALVSDGRLTPGQVAVINDTTITTAAAASAAAAAYLGNFGTTVRGSMQFIDTTPLRPLSKVVRAGSQINLTDAHIPLTGLDTAVMQIDKTFHPVREDWMIMFGGTQPRVSNLIRRLTRNTLS